MKVASGHVNDRPFARTVFSLASKRFTGDLIMTEKRRDTKVVWSGGRIVAAHSASPADTLGRQALTHGLVNSSTLGLFVQKLSENPGQDEVALLAELGKLSPEQCKTLKHHVLVRSAARIFALSDATFVVDNEPSIAADPELPALDVRWLIYFGLRTHYSQERLESELEVLGERQISLAPEAKPVLPAFGFGEYERHVLARLEAKPISLKDLLSSGLDAHVTSCVVYALVACGYVKYSAGQATAPETPTAEAVPSRPAPRRARTPDPVATAQGRARPTATPQTVRGVGFVEAKSAAAPETVRGVGFVEAGGASSSKAPSADAETTMALVKEKIRVLDSGGTHYEILGQANGAIASDVRKAYFQLARRLHPDRLQALGVQGMTDEIQRSFAGINEAFKVLSNPKLLEEYQKVLAAGGKAAYDAKQAEAEKLASAIFEAEEHFHLGEMALRRDQYGTAEKEFAKACALQPEESEYQALWAWAMYCNAQDRDAVESDAMKKVSSAILKSPKSVTTRRYHAKLLKLMGRNVEAINSFKKLIEMDPHDHEAKLELRVLEDQAKAGDDPKSKKKGFFGR